MNLTLRQIKIRVLCIALLWFAFLGLFIYRCYHVQIKRHDEFLKKAQERYTTSARRGGKRGEIFDRDGKLLVSNVPRITIACSPYSCVYEPYVRLENSRRRGVKESLPGRREKRRQVLSTFLAKEFGKTPEEFYRKLTPFVPVRDSKGGFVRNEDGSLAMKKNHFLLLEREATPEFAAAFREKLKKIDLDYASAGFVFKDIYIRNYPQGRLLANVLGFTNVEKDVDVAKSGLEKFLSSAIEPDIGEIIYERARNGIPLSYGIQQLKEGHNGNDIYLTISEPVQAILEEELDAAYEKWKPEVLYAMIAEPSTGNILALAQRPNFDPNDRSTFTKENMTVRIASDSYEPGSVMKPFTVGKALDWGFTTPDAEIDCGGRTWFYGGRALTDTHDYGVLTIGGIIQKSSNIGTAKLALSMGDERINKVMKTFRFGERTGLPFRPESRGRVPRINSRIDKLAITRVPIGYNISVSPFQLVRAYCALANGGMMPELRLLDRVRNAENGEMETMPLKPMVRTFDNPAALKQLVEMMITVTRKGGTATRASIPGYEVAGKTGTSRKYIPGKGYSENYYASFVGFVPARDPKLVMLVTFDSPKGSIYGGTVAAPVFKQTMERTLRYMNIPSVDFAE